MSSKREFSIPEIIASTPVPADFSSLHSNHAQIVIANEDLYLDFYQIEPDPHMHAQPIGRFVQRIVFPASNAKGLATALANVIAKYEKLTGVQLENRRPKDSEDLIEIWES